MKRMFLILLGAMTLTMMIASVAPAIDTVPVPEKPMATYGTVTTVNSGDIMIGTWPTPEKPKTLSVIILDYFDLLSSIDLQ